MPEPVVPEQKVKAQAQGQARPVTQTFEEGDQILVLTGPFPEASVCMGIPASYSQIQTPKEYKETLEGENLHRLRKLVPEEILIQRLQQAGEEEKPSYTQGLANAEAVTDLPFAFSTLKNKNPENIKAYTASRRQISSPKFCYFSIPFLNNKNELCGFSIRMIEHQGRYLSNIAVLSNSDKTPGKRDLTFISAVEMLPSNLNPDKHQLELDPNKVAKQTKEAVTATLKNAINSQEFERYINIERLRAGTKDSFAYLQEVMSCFPEQKDGKAYKEPDFERLEIIHNLPYELFDSTKRFKLNKKAIDKYINLERLNANTADSRAYLEELLKWMPGTGDLRTQINYATLLKIRNLQSDLFNWAGYEREEMVERALEQGWFNPELGSSPPQGLVNALAAADEESFDEYTEKVKQNKAKENQNKSRQAKTLVEEGDSTEDEQDFELPQSSPSKQIHHRIHTVKPKSSLSSASAPLESASLPELKEMKEPPTNCLLEFVLDHPYLTLAILTAIAVVILILTGEAGVLGAAVSDGNLLETSVDAIGLGSVTVSGSSAVAALGIFGLSKLFGKNSKSPDSSEVDDYESSVSYKPLE